MCIFAKQYGAFLCYSNPITNKRTPIRMSEEVLRSYRLTSMEEPTDEMLHAIMEKVAESARDSTRRAEAKKGEMLRIAIENANRKAAYIL